MNLLILYLNYIIQQRLPIFCINFYNLYLTLNNIYRRYKLFYDNINKLIKYKKPKNINYVIESLEK